MILDVFSRYVVGWMVAPRESAALAERLIAATCAIQGIEPDQLTLHADRGSSMRSKPVALLLADLGVVKTLKYCPAFPDRFGSLEDARAFGQVFFPWYNDAHHHSALGYLTPAMVHYGIADGVRAQRTIVLAAAYAAHPERFVRGVPQPAPLPTAVWINPPVIGRAVPEAAGTAHVTAADLRDHSLPIPIQLTEAVQ